MARRGRVGTYVLETLTTGMYTNPLDTIREYVQNAADSIRMAEQKGLIKTGEGRIEIRIQPPSRSVTIRDNGVGVPRDEIDERLLHVGVSSKNLEVDAGFRGIGRLAGIAYCRNVIFRTSTAGEAIASSFNIDCISLRGSFSSKLRHGEDLGEVMTQYSHIEESKCAKEEHFFEVVLRDLSDAALSFLNWQEMENYLGQVAPVEYDAQRFIFGPLISDWAQKYGFSLPTVTLIIKTPNMERQVFKPYKTHYKTSKLSGGVDVYIKDVKFYPESPSSGTQFWVWYGETDLRGSIDDNRAAGLRLRKNNISLGGPDRVREIFQEVAQSNGRFNSWYLGEIHVVNSEAIPNARRDGFEDVGAWPSIKDELREFIRDLCLDIREKSKQRNEPVTKVIDTSKRLIGEIENKLGKGLVSTNERDRLIERVTQQEIKATSLKHRKDPGDKPKIESTIKELQKVRSQLETTTEFVSKRLRPNLDRKQRKIVTEVLEVLQGVLDKPNFEKARNAIVAKFGVNGSGQ